MLLTALLALPLLQHFRCRHSKVGMSMTFIELCLITVFTISLHVCAVAGNPQGQPRYRLLTLQTLTLLDTCHVSADALEAL